MSGSGQVEMVVAGHEEEVEGLDRDAEDAMRMHQLNWFRREALVRLGRELMAALRRSRSNRARGRENRKFFYLGRFFCMTEIFLEGIYD